MLKWENSYRNAVCATWSEEQVEREELMGDVTIDSETRPSIMRLFSMHALVSRFGLDDARRGDEKMTFRYGL